MYNVLRLFHAPIPNIEQHDGEIIIENDDPFAILENVDIEVRIENGHVIVDGEIPEQEVEINEQHGDVKNVQNDIRENENAITNEEAVISVHENDGNEGNEQHNGEDEVNDSIEANIGSFDEILVDATHQDETDGSILNTNTNDSGGSSSEAIDPLKVSFAPNDTKETENESNVANDAENLNVENVKVENIPPIETNNAEALENLLLEADLSAPCSSKTIEKSGDNRNDGTEDIIWLDEPPKPIICLDYGLVKRDGDRFSGNEHFREMVNTNDFIF